ncbi:MAG TPA: alpha/beta hydrolase [Polyangiaceae bacterium]
MNASVAQPRPDNSTTVRTPPGPDPLALRATRGALGILSRVAPEGAAAVAERMFLTPRRRPRPDAEWDVLLTGEHVVLPTRHGDLAAWEWGSDGPRVLLVHGWEGRGSQLGGLVAPLTALGFRVATFDAPAHGDSPGRRSSLFHFADAIESAAQVFGPLHGIVTHSMGGASALWAYRDGPLAARTVMIAPPVDLRDFTRTLSTTLSLPERVRQRVHRRLGARFGVPVEQVRAERLARTMCGPLLVIHDENDREVPIACGEAVASAWPGAELLRTRGLGHQRILRGADTLRAVVRFVAQRAVPAKGAA